MTAPRPQRAELLRNGAAALQAIAQPCTARFSYQGCAFLALLEWPGVVSVVNEATGEVIAKSEPGIPAVPDLDTTCKGAFFALAPEPAPVPAHGPGVA